MLFCGRTAALLPCRLRPELGPRRMGGSQRPHGKASWSGELTSCTAVTQQAGDCVRARTLESHHLWGLAPGWGLRGQKGSWLVVGQQSSASHLQTRSPSSVLQQGTCWWEEGSPATTVSLFCPCCFSRTSLEVLGPWDGLLVEVEVEVGWELELGLPSLHGVFTPGVVATTAPCLLPQSLLVFQEGLHSSAQYLVFGFLSLMSVSHSFD